MHRAERVFFAILAVMGVWIAVQATRVHGIVATSAARLADTRLAPAGGPTAGASEPEMAPLPAPDRNLTEIRRRISNFETGTYIGEILAERDSNIARWPNRMTHPLSVWVQNADTIADWNPAFIGRVQDAFVTWSDIGIPVRFRFVADSSDADVHVTFVDHFDEQISGKTKWSRDENWWIVQANIEIALHHNHGQSLDAPAIRAIALHEVGHLLGLDHCADTSNIMTSRVHVRELSPADIATMRLIYSVPPGSIRANGV